MREALMFLLWFLLTIAAVWAICRPRHDTGVRDVLGHKSADCPVECEHDVRKGTFCPKCYMKHMPGASKKKDHIWSFWRPLSLLGYSRYCLDCDLSQECISLYDHIDDNDFGNCTG